MEIDAETQSFLDELETMSWEELQDTLLRVNLAVAQKQNKIVFSGCDNVQ
jgi:hypothetical protein